MDYYANQIFTKGLIYLFIFLKYLILKIRISDLILKEYIYLKL